MWNKRWPAYGGVAFGRDVDNGGVADPACGTAAWRHAEVVATNLLGDPPSKELSSQCGTSPSAKGLEEELKHQAFHDALSGLANRALFRDRSGARP